MNKTQQNTASTRLLDVQTSSMSAQHEEDLVQVVLVNVRGCRTRFPRILFRTFHAMKVFAPVSARFASLSFAVACLMGAGNAASGQTIVNGSFEQMASPPNNSGQWSLVPSWSNAGSSLADPDAFHLDGSAGGDLPETPVAIVNPKHGRGVMGFQASGLPGTNRREYLAGQFSEPLTPGARYIFTFHITNGARTPFSNAGLAVGGLGVSFSANPFNQTAWMPLNADPTFRMASPLYNPAWEEISFVFTATQAFQHFAIGLFGSDAAATIEYREGDSPQFAYYFVDDFSLELAPEDMESDADVVRGSEDADSPAVEGVEGMGWFVPNAFTPNRDGENDHFLPIVEESVKVRSFEVYNRWGQVIWTWQPGDAGWDGTIAGGAVNAEPGVFIWKLQLKDAEGRRSEHSGQVALLR